MLTVCHEMQMKYHILLPSVYYGILHFGCILKYNHVVLKKEKGLLVFKEFFGCLLSLYFTQSEPPEIISEFVLFLQRNKKNFQLNYDTIVPFN